MHICNCASWIKLEHLYRLYTVCICFICKYACFPAFCRMHIYRPMASTDGPDPRLAPNRCVLSTIPSATAGNSDPKQSPRERRACALSGEYSVRQTHAPGSHIHRTSSCAGQCSNEREQPAFERDAVMLGHIRGKAGEARRRHKSCSATLEDGCRPLPRSGSGRIHRVQSQVPHM